MQPEIPILILKTSKYENLWDKDGKAPYQRNYLKLPEEVLEKWKHDCPLPAISFYVEEQSNKPPSFLSIQDITYGGGNVYFSFRLISQLQNITSYDFGRELDNNDVKKLFYTVGYGEINSIFDKLKITPPEEWKKLLESLHNNDESQGWKSWIGEHFLKIDPNINHEINDKEYEDIVAEIFTALGFEVKQEGHLQPEEEVPDGKLKTENLTYNFAIVYDAKTGKNFLPRADDRRAMNLYLKKAIADPFLQGGIGKERIYFAYIARGYAPNINIGEIRRQMDVHSEVFLFTSEAMLRLLYWKIKLGKNFSLPKLEDLTSKNPINWKDVDEIYKKDMKKGN